MSISSCLPAVWTPSTLNINLFTNFNLFCRLIGLPAIFCAVFQGGDNLQAGKKSVICCTFICNIELRFLSIVLHKQEDMHLSVDVTREKEGLPSDIASYK